MPLDPLIKQALDSGFGLPIGKVPIEELRRQFKEIASSAPKERVHKIEDIEIEGSEAKIKARIYHPKKEGEKGMLVYFHGGGFVIGDIESYDPLCRALCNESDCVIASIEYRLAPENKFPSAVVDAIDATKWLFENKNKFGASLGLAVSGDSAGGNLAAVVAILTKGLIDLKQQILIYPVVSPDFSSKSMIEFSRGYFLEIEHMKWFSQQYFKSPFEILDVRASPILANDLSNLPPALIITAEYDPLRDQGEAYASKLAQFGVPVTCVRFIGVIHGFISFFHLLKQGRDALGLIGSNLRKVFYGKNQR